MSQCIDRGGHEKVGRGRVGQIARPEDRAFQLRRQRVAAALRAAVESYRFHWQNQAFGIGVSIGLVPISSASGSSADVLTAADSACYAAKDEGRNRVHVFRAGDASLARRYGEMRWVSAIQQVRCRPNKLPCSTCSGQRLPTERCR